MKNSSHAPARDHARSGLLGVGSNADTRPGSGDAVRSKEATKAASGDSPVRTVKIAPAVQRFPLGGGFVRAVRSGTLLHEEKKARGRCDPELCQLTPVGHLPNWKKARKLVAAKGVRRNHPRMRALYRAIRAGRYSSKPTKLASTG